MTSSIPPSDLAPPFNTSTTPLTLIAQGAESLLYRTTFLTPTLPAALKVRPKKPWRHPILDRRLTRSRILAEARVLIKCKREGVLVPTVYAVDWEAGWSVTEWIEGVMVKEWVREWDERERGRGQEEGKGGEEEALKGLLGRVGRAVGKLHSIGVVHGDLTSSNMMLRQGQEEEVVLIDFGLATVSNSEEDRAVDLYVLERAFGSTHPRQEQYFDVVLEGYAEAMGKAGKIVLRRLEDVRMRGRKKSMIG